MIKEYIEKWNENKHLLENYFKNTPQSEYHEYDKIVKKVVELIINKESYSHNNLDIENMTVIDNGDYQGTQIYIIPRKTYQPDIDDYVYTHNYYGSCSGCDTLQGISDYDSGLPNDEQVKDYMLLALNIIENFKKLGGE